MRVVGVDADIIVYICCFVAKKQEENGVYLTWYQVSKIVDTVYNNVLLGSKATHHLGFLTDSRSNFRVAVAKTLVYKGQRENTEKPPFFSEVKHYLEKHWGCQMMRGVEADDALVIAGEHFKTKGVDYIIASKDKDLHQYPCEHFDMNKGKEHLFHISRKEAHRNLWEQVILGDLPTDNIPGLTHAAQYMTTVEFNKKVRAPKDLTYGKTRANSILDEVAPEDYARHILTLYIEEYDDVEYGLGERRFLETYTLVKLLTKAPKELKIHFNPLRVKRALLEFEDETNGDY